jgi:hypothetical protein
MCGYRNDLPPPPFNAHIPSTKPGCGPGTHRALRSDFLDWLRSLPPKTLSETTTSFLQGSDLSLTIHLFRIAAANTQSNLRELQDATEYIENRMHGFWRFKGYDIDEETAADCIQMLRYFSMDNVRVTEETLSLLRGRFKETPTLRDSLRTDFVDLVAKLRDLRARTETDINYFVARLSAKEAHRAQLQADELKWMNYAIFMLGPVSTLAAILALQERDRNVMTFLLCACGAGLVIILLRFWGSIPGIVRGWGGRVMVRMRARRGETVRVDVGRVGEEALFDYLGKEVENL